METLWSPWRHEYISASGSNKPTPCFFCIAKQNPADDVKNLVVYRGQENLVILNRYPYTSGHLLIAPYGHMANVSDAPKPVTDELMDLVKRCEQALRDVYRPGGINVGMNLGNVAGAGVADHIHMHILPRWGGDTNFMTTVGNARVIPEDLQLTYEKLKGKI